jgi:hypothetical protein
MALQALNSQYWPSSDYHGPPPPTTVIAYPVWQIVAATACSLLCVLGLPQGTLIAAAFFPIWHWQLTKVWRQRVMVYWNRVPVRLKLTFRLLHLLWSPDWIRANQIVREVAVLPGMHDPNVWGDVGNYMGKHPGVGENVYRHLFAAQRWGPEEKLVRHTRNLMLELAYYGLKEF